MSKSGCVISASRAGVSLETVWFGAVDIHTLRALYGL